MYLFIPLIVIIIIIVIVILLLLLLLEDTNLSSYLDTASREREREMGGGRVSGLIWLRGSRRGLYSIIKSFVRL